MVQKAFGRCKRPVHFTNRTHCSECEEHDRVLRSRTVETLRLQDIENPGWDPLCFVSADGFKYYFPALARFTLKGTEADWYGHQFFFHLTYQGPENRHLLACNDEQRASVAALLRHLAETRAELVDKWLATDELNEALDLWKDTLAKR